MHFSNMISHKMVINCRLFSNAIFSVITLALIAFLILAGTQISSLSVDYGIITTSRVYKALQTPCDALQTARKATVSPKMDRQVHYSTSNQQRTEEIIMPTQATNEEEEKQEESEAPDVIPPANFTSEERKEWFRKKVPGFELLKSNDLGQKFHGRVMEFFDKNCTNQFFMVWLSPARTFGPREFLAADTLLKANPEACLMILSRSLDTGRGYRMLKPLLDRGLKIVAVTPDLPFLVKNTAAETWLDDIKSGKRDPGTVSLSVNLSNLIRLAILYKYGGVYLDTDFIITKNFKGLRNAVGVQTIDSKTKKWGSVNNAAMIFDIAHPILVEFLKEFATTFNGSIWGHNGPYMLTRVINRLHIDQGATAFSITILPIKAFYPVDWEHITKLYENPKTKGDAKWVEDTLVELNSNSYGLHLWNKITRDLVIEEGSVIQRLIASHCLICKHVYNA